MNFDFSNRIKLKNFYDIFNTKKSFHQYPLFEKLRADLLSEELSPSDFADTFGMNEADGIVLKAIWLNECNKIKK